MRTTLYGQFVAGTKTDEVKQIVDKFKQYNVKVILDYSMESDISTSITASNNVHKSSFNTELDESNTFKIYHPDERIFNTNMFNYIKNSNTSRELCGQSSFIAMKITALVRPLVLQKLNQFLESRITDHNLFDTIDSLLTTKNDFTHSLTPNELGEISNLLLRINRIIQTVKKNEGRIFIDAEQSYFQTAINKIVIHLQRLYNRNNLLVYNTYQCYKK
ncbi:unnamed protein product, partial [Didymodactylos carnosus]